MDEGISSYELAVIKAGLSGLNAKVGLCLFSRRSSFENFYKKLQGLYKQISMDESFIIISINKL